ncbi:hypothetical protein [Thermococcus sp.]|uniref:hypothetical protein n=1 Tax=Thermococcus sp. TaxID=35749 RepID=UPI00261D44D3|nr:hypothetical protein [Thermococcus sp.]
MPSSLLDFQEILKTLAVLFGENEFDSRTAAEAISRYLYRKRKDPRILKRTRPKLISNDLRRLYQMGFLKRRKVPRECRNKKGRVYNCGSKYMYKITRQGWSYLKHLEERGSLKFTLRELAEVYKSVQIAIEKIALMELLEKGNLGSYILMRLITEDINRWFSSQGFRRFQVGQLLFKQETTLLAYFYKVITDLEEQIRLRDLQIELLMEELRRCREKHHLGVLNLPTVVEFSSNKDTHHSNKSIRIQEDTKEN